MPTGAGISAAFMSRDAASGSGSASAGASSGAASAFASCWVVAVVIPSVRIASFSAASSARL